MKEESTEWHYHKKHQCASLEEQVVGRQREVYTGKIEHYKQSIEKREINVSEEMHIFYLTGS